ncbi:MAG: hypothetical protein RSD40_03245 [Bacilli bacterium]
MSISKEIEDLKNELIFEAREVMKDTMLSLMVELQDETNKDTGRASAGWIMTEGLEKSNYLPDKTMSIEYMGKDKPEDPKQVAARESNLDNAKTLCSSSSDVNYLSISNNVDYLWEIEAYWNVGFFDKAVNKAKEKSMK